MNIQSLVLYFALAAVGGMIVQRCKVPGGMMVGAALFCGVGNILFDIGAIPSYIKLSAQILTGIYIGLNVDVQELKNLGKIVKPLMIVIVGLLLTNILTGLIIVRFSPMNLMSALLAASAGGVNNMPLIAGDLGGDPSIVAIFQCVRMIIGIGIFPSMIYSITVKTNGKPLKKDRADAPVQKEPTNKKQHIWDLIKAGILAVCGGIFGSWLNIPSSYLLLPILTSIFYKGFHKEANASVNFRRIAQILSGIYIGSCFNAQNSSMMRSLGIPIAVMIALFIVNFIVCGFILYKLHCFDLMESLLAASPAGASDMALITADLGIQNTYLNLLHVLRLLVVITVFPFVFDVLVRLL